MNAEHRLNSIFAIRLTALVAAVLTCQALSAAESIAILPARLTLSGPEARQIVVVEQLRDGKFVGQIAAGVEIISGDPKIVTVENGVAMPVGNGQTTIAAKVGQQTATAEVTVADVDKPFTWNFHNHVLSVISKSGCNSGACHGALAGKKGFKLTLFGYDAEADYRVLLKEARGRRVNLDDPGRSLILTKPTGMIPHKGGVRFEPDSREYRVLAEWIAAGAPAPSPSDPKLARLEILPKATVLSRQAKQQLIVRAHFSDGRAEDVTRWAKFTSANETVAAIDKNGLASVMGFGEGAITAWYLNTIVIATVSVPYDNAVKPELFDKAPRRNFIDELVLAKLKSLNLPPSPRASDEQFLRRVYLDTIGVLPTADEVRSFQADRSPDKRDKLIDRLLARPEFVDYWAYKWSDLLLVNSEKLRPPAATAYYQWIRKQVAANTPWDKFARDVVTATGGTLENGAANFYVLHQDPADMSETVSMGFLGMSIACAKCHNHPLEKWTNNQYYGMANLLARVRTKNLSGDGNLAVYSATDGELVQPSMGRPQLPQPLDGQPIALETTADRRVHLANWLAAPENPYFTRAIVNRVWANFLGVGLVERVDDLRLTNPASNEELLAALAKYLVKNRYDLKQLMRTILQSETYQRSNTPLAENRADTRYYSHYYPRRLMAEVLLDAMSQASGAPSEFAGYKKGTRAIELPDANVASYFLKTFGRPDRVITCECERTAEPSMVQVLHISNGDTLNQKLEAKGNAIETALAGGAPNYKIVESLYLTALSRYPTDAELAKYLAELSTTPADQRRQAIEDLFWAVLSGKEFLFNH